MSAAIKTFGLAVLLAALNVPVVAEPYEQLARKITEIASRSGYKRIAVMPLQPIAGGEYHSGQVLAARLVSRLASEPTLEIIERTLLAQVLSEQGLGYKGIIRQDQAKAIGQILGVDAIVTGTYLKLRRGKLEVHARLIDTQTARILGAATVRVQKEWDDEPTLILASADVWDTPPPTVVGFKPKLKGFENLPGLRDAISNWDPCENWETRIRKTQAATIDIGARYWAARMKDPRFSTESLTQNPGSDIRSPQLRRKFYDRIEKFIKKGDARGLSIRERERLGATQRKVKRILAKCYYR